MLFEAARAVFGPSASLPELTLVNDFGPNSLPGNRARSDNPCALITPLTRPTPNTSTLKQARPLRRTRESMSPSSAAAEAASLVHRAEQPPCPRTGRPPAK